MSTSSEQLHGYRRISVRMSVSNNPCYGHFDKGFELGRYFAEWIHSLRLFSRPVNRREYLWTGSQSVIIRSNFTCVATNCKVECCSKRKAGKCIENFNEIWYYNCSRRTDEPGSTVVVTGDNLTRKELYYCSVEVVIGPEKYQQEGYFTTTDGRKYVQNFLRKTLGAQMLIENRFISV